MPKISVIIPVYKVEKYLHRCVDSILSQTFTDFELILVDDGSPDNCGAICDDYAKADSRIHVIHQENRGVSAARNAGIDWSFANSNSQWIAFVDGDDWIHSRYLDTLYTNAKESNVRISACMLQELHDGDSLLTTLNEAPPICMDVESAYVKHYGVLVLSFLKLYDKSLFEHIRFPVGRVYGEDTFITHQLLFLCDRIVISPCVLYYYFQHSQSVVHSSWKPKYLDDIEAHEHRLDYLEKNGYRKAFEKEKWFYAGRLRYHLEKIQQSEWKGSKYEKLLRNKLRIALIRYRNVVSFSENKWIYESAYPTLMNVYWIASGKWNKLKSKLGVFGK